MKRIFSSLFLIITLLVSISLPQDKRVQTSGVDYREQAVQPANPKLNYDHTWVDLAGRVHRLNSAGVDVMLVDSAHAGVTSLNALVGDVVLNQGGGVTIGIVGQNINFGINASNITNGILGIAQGGTNGATGQAGFDNLSPLTTANDLITFSGGHNVRLATGLGTQLLHGGNIWAQVNLASDVTGLLPNGNLANSSITVAGTANQISIVGSPVSLGGTVTVSLPNALQLPGTETIGGATLGANALLAINPLAGLDNSAVVTIGTNNVNNRGLTVQGVLNQIADLQQWQNYNGAPVAYVGGGGLINATGFYLLSNNIALSISGSALNVGSQFSNVQVNNLDNRGYAFLAGTVSIGNLAGGGNIGTAPNTVDIAGQFNVNQTTAGQAITLPSPTSATTGRLAVVNNIGTQSFTLYGVVTNPNQSTILFWNGTAWSVDAPYTNLLALNNIWSGSQTFNGSTTFSSNPSLSGTTSATFTINSGGNQGIIDTSLLSGNHTLKLPNVNGNLISSGDSGTVTNTMLLNSSVTINGTTNQINTTSASIPLGNSVTLSIPSTFIAPGTIQGTTITATIAFTNPGAGGGSERFGSGAITGATTNSFAAGNGADVLANGGVAVGSSAFANSGVAVGQNVNANISGAIGIGNGVSAYAGLHTIIIGDSGDGHAAGNNKIGIGANIIVSGSEAIAIGDSSNASFADSIAFGPQTVTTAINQFVVGGSCGGDACKIVDIYFGNGVTNTVPDAWTLHGVGGSGTDIAGGSINISGGAPTGAGLTGNIVMRTTITGASGTALRTPTEIGRWDNNGLTVGVAGTRTGILSFSNGTGANTTQFEAGVSAPQLLYVWPVVAPTAGQFISASAPSSGVVTLSFATAGGGGGTPGGTDTNVQYNNAGAFGGSANFVWNNANQKLTLTGKPATDDNLVLTESSTTTTFGNDFNQQTFINSSLTNNSYSTIGFGVQQGGANLAAIIVQYTTASNAAGSADINFRTENAGSNHTVMTIRHDQIVTIPSGNLLGIGTSNPTVQFNSTTTSLGNDNSNIVVADPNTSLTSGNNAGNLSLINTDTTNNNYSSLIFSDSANGSAAGRFACIFTGHTGSLAGQLVWQTRSGGVAATRASLDNTGFTLSVPLIVNSSSKYQVNTSGVLANYNNIATTGFGQPIIVGSDSKTNRSSAVTTTTLFTPSSTTGLYEIVYYFTETQAATVSSAAQVTISWTDSSGTVQTFTGANVIGNSVGAKDSGVVTIDSNANAITYAESYSSTGGVPLNYNIKIIVKEIQ